MNPKDALYAHMSEYGWTPVERRGRLQSHHKVRCAHGCCQVTYSRTPSDPRALKNALAQLKRCPAYQAAHPREEAP